MDPVLDWLLAGDVSIQYQARCQHVLAAQGTTSSIIYLIGFLGGAVLYHVAVYPALVAWIL